MLSYSLTEGLSMSIKIPHPLPAPGSFSLLPHSAWNDSTIDSALLLLLSIEYFQIFTVNVAGNPRSTLHPKVMTSSVIFPLART